MAAIEAYLVVNYRCRYRVAFGHLALASWLGGLRLNSGDRLGLRAELIFLTNLIAYPSFRAVSCCWELRKPALIYRCTIIPTMFSNLDNF